MLQPAAESARGATPAALAAGMYRQAVPTSAAPAARMCCLTAFARAPLHPACASLAVASTPMEAAGRWGWSTWIGRLAQHGFGAVVCALSKRVRGQVCVCGDPPASAPSCVPSEIVRLHHVSFIAATGFRAVWGMSIQMASRVFHCSQAGAGHWLEKGQEVRYKETGLAMPCATAGSTKEASWSGFRWHCTSLIATKQASKQGVTKSE